MTKLCDSCFMAAQDEGAEGLEDMLMFELGGEVPDHLCDRREEPELRIVCKCACSRSYSEGY